MWEPFAQQLDWPTLALDLPGHGNQPHLDGEVDLKTLADDVAQRIPYQRYHLLGFSLGALISQYIAATGEKKPETLICVSSVAQRTEQERAAVLHRLETAKQEFTDSVKASLQRWYPAEHQVDKDIVAATQKVLLGNHVPSYMKAYNVFATGDATVAPLLPQISVPTLAITGEHDPGSSPDMSHRLAAAIPGAQAVIVPDARHMFPVTHSAILAAAVENFLTQTKDDND